MINTIVSLFIVIMLLIVGILVKFFKVTNIIAGYNNASDEEKKYMDKKGLSDFVGNSILILGAIVLAGYILSRVGLVYAELISWLAFVIIIFYMVYKSRDFVPLHKKNENRWALVLAAAIFVLMLFMGSMSLLEPQINIESNELQFSAPYGVNVNKAEIEKIFLLDSIPSIIAKSKGVQFAAYYKGVFQIEEIGRSNLFIIKANEPVIYINAEEKNIFINLSNQEETRELYETLLEWIKEDS